MKNRKSLSILLVAVLLVSVMAMPFAAMAKTDASQKILNVYIASQPETIDPQMNSSADGGVYIRHMFEGIMRTSDDGLSVVPGMAADMPVVNEDMTVYTYTLRDGVTWSDGKPVTAADFVYAARRLVDPALASPYAEDMGGFLLNADAVIAGEKPLEELGVKAIDEKTVEYTLVGPCAFFNEIVNFYSYYPVREDMAAGNDRWALDPATYITNGAYTLESFTSDSEIVVKKNPNFYRADEIKNDGIRFVLMSDDNAAIAAFRAGEIQYADNVPSEETDALKAEGTYFTHPILGTYYVSFNMTKAPFDDVNVRKAFSLAIDRDYINTVIFFGARAPGNNFVGSGFADVEATDQFEAQHEPFIGSDYEANKKLAQEALAEAGYPNGEGFPVVEYMYNTNAGHKTIAEALQQMWQDVLGVSVNLSNQEWNVFLETRRLHNYDIARNGWLSDYNDPLSMLNLFISDSGNNDGAYNNPEYDAKVAIAQTSSDRAVRMQAMHEAEAILMGDWACAPVVYYNDDAAIDTHLKGVTFTPMGSKAFFFAYMDNWE